jgi:hypothetical protein
MRLLTFSWLLLAVISNLAKAAALHPCALQLIVKDKSHLVVGMKGQDPVYQDGEKLKRYRPKAYYEVSRGAQLSR